ncbi:ABC transporter substrate-binding protein [Clostridium ljungdahlii]|uniref:ABC transporter substrate-binding protein n=1 Tax=Clostridium ljungdahlii TaxID=1538 RepID=UPI003869DFA6
MLEEDISIRKTNFLAHIVCPMQQIFRRNFQMKLNEYKRLTGKTFKCHIAVGCGGSDKYDDIWKVKSIEDFPDIVASVTFGNFFRKDFIEKFVYKGYFKSVIEKNANEDFVRAGLEDPDGNYSVYSVFPLVMLVDKNKLGNLPMPKKWSDLLKPIYKNNIIVSGSQKGIGELLPLYIYKDYAEKGLQMLAANIKEGWHASKMSKVAGTLNNEGAAIYVLSWFFAKVCPRKEYVSVVWPEDGAIAEPIYMLVKKSKINELKEIINFITGSEYGQKCASYYFPSANAAIDNNLPQNASFKWLGWEYIKRNDIYEVKEHVRDKIMQYYKLKNRVEGGFKNET